MAPWLDGIREAIRSIWTETMATEKKASRRYAVCIANKGNEASLERVAELRDGAEEPRLSGRIGAGARCSSRVLDRPRPGVSMRTVATFRSAAFNTSEARPYFINPGCFGDDLAK